jgi:GNAT superfamily N-acetyltransferase
VTHPPRGVVVRQTRPEHFDGIIQLSRTVYPDSPPWRADQLASHLTLFPEGQFVALHEESGRVAGMAASLIVLWDDYDMHSTWRDFTDHGMFTNHDPRRGRTLYGAEIMVHPEWQGKGVGSLIYDTRRSLARRLRLLRIRAGARLRGYHRYADRMSPEEYAIKVARGECTDPTLTFQLHRGFVILAVVSGYLRHDAESLGHAAVIEWLNPDVATSSDYAGRDPRFLPPAAGTTPR